MKIRVQHTNGVIEVITLVPPVTNTILGNQLNRIVDSTGMEHWFDQDGYYDGWGRAFAEPVPETDMSIQDYIDGVEQSREFLRLSD